MAKSNLSDSASTLRFICILATARTGSSHLCRLLRNCPELNIKSELFHPKGRGAIDDAEFEALRTLSNGVVVDDESLCAWRSANPGLTLDTLFEMGGSKPVVFKIFPGHVEQNLVASEIFQRQDVGYILLRRRPIESFISSRKARVATTHSQVDTTQTKLVLSTNEFIKWYHLTRGWYDWVTDEIKARKLPRTKISYDRNLKNVDNTKALTKILGKLASIGFPDFKPRRNIKSLTRQDREDRYQNKVANWPEFEAELREDPETASFLDWAETVG